MTLHNMDEIKIKPSKIAGRPEAGYTVCLAKSPLVLSFMKQDFSGNNTSQLL